MCLGTCGFKEHFFARHFLWTFWKCLGKCGWKEFFFARQFLYGNIESVWDSADATNTFFQTLFMERLVCALYTYLQSLSLLVKLSDLLLLANLAKMSLFTHLLLLVVDRHKLTVFYLKRCQQRHQYYLWDSHQPHGELLWAGQFFSSRSSPLTFRFAHQCNVWKREMSKNLPLTNFK